MSELTLLWDRIQSLFDEAHEIDMAFADFTSIANVTKVRSLRPRSVLESAMEELDGEKRPEFYDDWEWSPNREQDDLRRSIVSRYEVWFNASAALIREHLPDRWDDFSARYPYVRETLECNNMLPHAAGKRFNDGHRVQQYRRLAESLDRQVNLILAVPQVVEMKALDVRRLVGNDLIEAELDRAESLLQRPGRITLAMLRAAGIIAAVALERHLKLVADEYNSRRARGQDAIEYTGEDGIADLAVKLRRANLLEATEMETLRQMGITCLNCLHPMRGDRRRPTRAEVAFLIQKAKEYARLNFFR